MSVVIKPVIDELDKWAELLRSSFITVADAFGITRENAPTNPAFADTDSLSVMLDKGVSLFGAYCDDMRAGFVALEDAGNGCWYMERLAVLPEYRHKGIGRMLMDFAFGTVKEKGGKKISIGIINENKVLKDWYTEYGFAETGTRVFKHLPFEVCFMEKPVGRRIYGST
jgi:ribosomal protein S18 acetylase RimI-like enzyme